MPDLVEVADALRPVRRDLADWLSGALAADDPVRALGISRCARRRAAIFWLRHASELLPAEMSANARATVLARRLRQLSRVQRPDDVDLALRRAQAAGPLPTSARRIFDLIAG